MTAIAIAHRRQTEQPSTMATQRLFTSSQTPSALSRPSSQPLYHDGANKESQWPHFSLVSPQARDEDMGVEIMAYQQDQDDEEPPISPREDVIQRIEHLAACIVESLDEGDSPVMSSLDFCDDDTTLPTVTKRFQNMSQCRGFTSVLLVLSFCHSLLLSNRTTSTREVYYSFVTHFRHQKECDSAISQAAALLHVPRVQLGLTASPKGWFCGCLEILHPNGTVVDASSLSSVQGLPITREWIDRSHTTIYDDEHHIQLQTTARCILVIEKEGIYTRLSEDRFFDAVPCILICGKGIPDLATRSLVHQLHMEFPDLPVLGLCDCNPYGLQVLQTYVKGSDKLGVDGGLRYSVPMEWIGLLPSHVQAFRNKLPTDVLQAFTDHDKTKIRKLINDESPHAFHKHDEFLRGELKLMQQQNFKVELEALHWMGMDFFSEWLEDMLWEDYLDGACEAMEQ